jgi:hypothetical protein
VLTRINLRNSQISANQHKLILCVLFSNLSFDALGRCNANRTASLSVATSLSTSSLKISSNKLSIGNKLDVNPIDIAVASASAVDLLTQLCLRDPQSTITIAPEGNLMYKHHPLVLRAVS